MLNIYISIRFKKEREGGKWHQRESDKMGINAAGECTHEGVQARNFWEGPIEA